MPPLDASEIDVPIEFDALTSDPRIKDVEMRPGAAFEMGSGRRLKTMAGSGGVVVFDDKTDVVACVPASCASMPTSRAGSARPAVKARVGWRGFAHVWRKAKVGPGYRPAGRRGQRDRGQFHLRPGRGRCLAHAGVPHQVPRRLRGAAAQGPGVMNLAAHSASLAETIGFAILSAGVLAGGLMTITRRNPVSAVMSLVLSFAALAGLFATLSAHFLAVLQILVYAGAIMVLFVFVVMMVNREESTPIARQDWSRAPSGFWRLATCFTGPPGWWLTNARCLCWQLRPRRR